MSVSMPYLSRRAFILSAPLVTGACASMDLAETDREGGRGGRYDDPRYAAIDTEPHPVQAIDLSKIDPVFLRQEVSYDGPEVPGTVVVDPSAHFLYLVRANGSAIRYGVGVGKEGFGWSGDATIKRKAAWPTWTPPAEMVARDPKAAPWANGMPGGPDNPLGARAMYLFQGDRDTLYRIHGTIQPSSIGKSMSSGCIRLLNQDIIDLYGRVPVGTKAVVLSSPGAMASAGSYQDEPLYREPAY